MNSSTSQALRRAAVALLRTLASFWSLYVLGPWDAIAVRLGSRSSYALRAQRREAIRLLVDLDAERSRIALHIQQIDAALAAHHDEERDAALRRINHGG